MQVEELIEKMLRGECSPEEMKQLEVHFNNEDQNPVSHQLKKYWEESKAEKEAIDERVKDLIWSRIENKVFVNKLGSYTIGKTPVWLVAASLLILIGVGFTWWFTTQDQPRFVEYFNQSIDAKEIHLDDGSIVWLNRDSRIELMQPFSSDLRKVDLVGEAFFNITKNPNKPFIVNAEGIQTKVLGTSFNIKTGQEISVSLVEGSVEITSSTSPDTIQLHPKEQLIFQKSEQRFYKNIFENDIPYAWKDGIIYFQKATVNEVASKLEKHYGVKFNIKDENAFKGTLVHRCDTKKLSLEKVLDNISTVMDYQFFRQPDGSYSIEIKK